jgi:tyrosine-specific transport protein
MQEKPGVFSLFAVMALVTGNLIGAGILALPVSMGLAGMTPSLLAMVVYGGMMFFTAIILAREATEKQDVNFDYPSLYQRYLGKIGKYIATAANMLILYGLLTAYITGGSKIIGNILNMPDSLILMLIFAAILIILTSLDLSIIQKYNVALIIILGLSFISLVVMGEEHASLSHLKRNDWPFAAAAIPLVVTAFHFHNIIPTLCGDLKWNSSTIWKAMLGGMILAFIMNVLWVQTGIGCLPLYGENSILDAYHSSTPATVPMSNIIHSRAFMVFATAFSMLAIVTSFLANGVGLQSFIRDLLYNSFNVRKKFPVMILTFTPPVVVSMLWPDIFLRAIDVVGGIGIVILFGILPCIIAIIKKGNTRMVKITGVVFLVLAIFAFCVEVAQETGLARIVPSAEIESLKDHTHMRHIRKIAK